MKKILCDIMNYVEFLHGNGYEVYFSDFGNRFQPFTEALFSKGVHHHSVCHYLKQNKSTQGECVLNKRRLRNADIREPFYGCCYAGVEEWVIPVYDDGIRLLLISVSGYRDTLESSARHKKRIAAICDDEFPRAYAELSVTPPSFEKVMSFIRPLEHMLIALYRGCREQSQNSEAISVAKSVYLRAMNYIYENYMHKIHCEDVAKEIQYSSSYLRYIFKTEGAGSVAKKINDVRLERAKYLLTNTSLTVTEVAFRTGFGDSNYFSTFFKKTCGLSPKAYRKQGSQWQLR